MIDRYHPGIGSTVRSAMKVLGLLVSSILGNDQRAAVSVLLPVTGVTT